MPKNIGNIKSTPHTSVTVPKKNNVVSSISGISKVTPHAHAVSVAGSSNTVPSMQSSTQTVSNTLSNTQPTTFSPGSISKMFSKEPGDAVHLNDKDIDHKKFPNMTVAEFRKIKNSYFSYYCIHAGLMGTNNQIKNDTTLQMSDKLEEYSGAKSPFSNEFYSFLLDLKGTPAEILQRHTDRLILDDTKPPTDSVLVAYDIQVRDESNIKLPQYFNILKSLDNIMNLKEEMESQIPDSLFDKLKKNVDKAEKKLDLPYANPDELSNRTAKYTMACSELENVTNFKNNLQSKINYLFYSIRPWIDKNAVDEFTHDIYNEKTADFIKKYYSRL